MFRLLVVFILFLGAQGTWNGRSILSKDYPIETHQVTTSDGYILGLQRVPYGRNSRTRPRKVAFLMHGVTFGSSSFTYLGPKYAIAYNLAEAGYDVWMGNARGNSFSRRHVSLDPDVDSMKFFDFDYEDMAMFDLPAMFDYVLDITGHKKLYYIGYSMGGTLFYVLNSRSSAYHSKIAAAHLLAGIGYPQNLPNINMRIISKSADIIYSVALRSGIVEVPPSNFTSAVMEVVGGTQVPSEIIVGSGLKPFVHYLQNMRDKRFASWNYGSVGNVVKYGSVLSPAYDLSKINIDVTAYYSIGDITQSETDVLAMVNAMPCARARKIARDDFDHIDYLVSKDTKVLVTDYIIQSINRS